MIIASRTQFHVESLNSVLNVKAVVAAFNQEKALVGAFSVITNLRMEHFEALLNSRVVACSRIFGLICFVVRGEKRRERRLCYK